MAWLDAINMGKKLDLLKKLAKDESSMASRICEGFGEDLIS
jgi:hypothetical protein